MEQLLLHSETRRLLQSIVASQVHALLISGPLGAGKVTVARTVAKLKLGQDLEVAPYFLPIRIDGKSITIEQAREIQNFLQLKTTGKRSIRRVVLIEDAGNMTREAQNALLKSLEEPPADTFIIMTVQSPNDVLETIRSRSQHVAIRRVTLNDAEKYFATSFPVSDIEWAHAISDGQVGLMVALLENKADHAVAGLIQTAKELYGMSSFERLTKVDKFAKTKEQLPTLLYACKRIAITALESAAKKNNAKAMEQWHRQLKFICATEEAMKYNPNPKLLLADLFISM